MKFKFLLCLLAIGYLLNSAYAKEQIDFKYYHTTQRLNSELKEIVAKCRSIIQEVSFEQSGLSIENMPEELKQGLKYYKVGHTQKNKSKNVFKSVVVAGEHARELISSEIALAMLKHWCDNQKNKNELYLLSNHEVYVVVNANPLGRLEVEKGDYCKRTNLNNVDINRNWDYNFGKEIVNPEEEFPGKEAFSEFETKFLKELIEKVKPSQYITLHSGEFGLFHPYAFDDRIVADRNLKQMKNSLKFLKNTYCKSCKTGSPEKILTYKSSGTALDYLYSNKIVDYSFAFELYTNEIPYYHNSKLMNHYNEKKGFSFLEMKNKFSAQRHSRAKVRRIQLRNKAKDENENQECLYIFSPVSKASYDFFVNNWKVGISNFILNVHSEDIKLKMKIKKR